MNEYSPTSQRLQEPPSYLRAELDKSYYVPGEKVRGRVVVYVNRTTNVRSIGVFFNGREKIRIDSPPDSDGNRGQYSSTNEMLNVGLRLVENSVLRPTTHAFPFQFDLPKDALPSFIGKYTDVTWRIWARADIP